MEDQDYDTILAECGDGLWTDDVFPPKNSSICPAQDWKEETYGEYEWVRATKVPVLTDDEGDLQVFVDDPTPDDINQGALGDCYFLSALSVLAEKSDRIRNIFEEQGEPNDFGIYGVKMFKNGVSRTIVLDDYIVCKNAQPAFSKANGPELWVLLCEKAWAKIHGSFNRTISGMSHLAMRDMTGAPAYEYIINKTDDIIDKIAEADKKGYIMSIGCGQEGADSAALKELGLVTEHSYGLLQYANVADSSGNQVDIVKLRNPWGKFEWKGDWGDESKLWTEEAKQECNVTVEDDGCFWMDFETVQQYFDRIQMCKVQDGYKYSYSQTDPMETKKMFFVQIDKAGVYTFSLSQVGRRMFPEDSKYTYSASKIWVYKNEDGADNSANLTYVRGVKAYGDRELNLEIDVEESGVYGINMEIFWNKDSAKTMGKTPMAWVASCYGPEEVNLDQKRFSVNMDNVWKAIVEIMIKDDDYDVKEETPEDEEPLIKKYTIEELKECGYIIYAYKNETKSSIYSVMMDYPKFDGMNMVLPDPSMQGFNIEVDPGNTEVVVINTNPRGHSFSSSVRTKVEVGYSELVAKCLAEGIVKERGEGIYCKKLTHSNGYIMVWRNETKDKQLNETLSLTLKGLSYSVNQLDFPTKGKVEIKVMVYPNTEENPFVIQCDSLGGGYSFGMGYSFLIEDYSKEQQEKEGAETSNYEEIAENPGGYAIILTGHNETPAFNGQFKYGGEENGKAFYYRKDYNMKLKYTGEGWECFKAMNFGASPETLEGAVETPVPPMDGYNKDGDWDIKVVYKKLSKEQQEKDAVERERLTKEQEEKDAVEKERQRLESLKYQEQDEMGSYAGSKAGSKAGSYAGSKAGSKAGSYAGSKAGSAAGSRAGSAAGSRAGSAAGSAAMSKGAKSEMGYESG